MATGFGIGPDAQGNGTTPDDIQVITAAEYANPGILAGCEVTGTTGMSYQIKPGAVVIALAKDRYVKAPVAPQSIPTEPAPTVGSRTDVIYIKQNLTASDGNNAVVAGVGRSAPANSIEIGRYVVSAGVTSTNQATRAGDTKYARPIGGTLGTLATHTEMDTTPRGAGTFKRGATSFSLPTDRTIEFQFQSCVSVDISPPSHQPERPGGSVVYRIYIDDVMIRSYERRYTNVWDVQTFSFRKDLSAGRHTVHYTVHQQWIEAGSSGLWRVRYGGVANFPGDVYWVNDIGIAYV